MKKWMISLVCLLSLLLYNQNYQHIISKYAERLVTIEFELSYEVRGEVQKRIGKTVGIVLDESKVLTTSMIFEDEAKSIVRLRTLTNFREIGFSNFKAPKQVKILYAKKEIPAELVFADFEKGIAIVKTSTPSFPSKPIKFVEKALKIGNNVTIYSLLPLKTFEIPGQIINCSISLELIKKDNKFYQCDKQIGHIPAGLVFDEETNPIGVLATPTSIPESINDEKDNYMAAFYGLSHLVILPFSAFKSFIQQEGEKTSKIWLGFLPETFSIYFEDKLKDILKDSTYKVALNIDKIIPESPLQKSEIYETDLIVEINGEKIENIPHKSKTDILLKLASIAKPLEFVTFKVYRKSEEKFLDIKVTPLPQPMFWDDAPEMEIKELGIKVKELTIDYKLKRKLDLSEKGFVVVSGENISKDPTNKNFYQFDVIKKIEKVYINTLQDIANTIAKVKEENKKTVSLEVIRQTGSEENETWNLRIELK